MESERLRNSLLSAISHDLRTPLAALVGMADTMALTDPPPTPQQREIVESVRQSALRMNGLVNNLLDMARLEAGSVQLNRQWQPLEEVVGSALAACAPVLRAAQCGSTSPTTCRCCVSMPCSSSACCAICWRTLPSTHQRVQPIELAARATSDAVALTVDDHGPGLPRGKEEAIFQKFERGSKESATPGVGLGLAICRAIVAAHGGTINAQTRPGGGAHFTVRLPRGEPPSMDSVPEAKAEGAS